MSAIPRRHEPEPMPADDAIAAATRAFFRAADLWGLTNDECRTLLGRPARATYFQWKRGETKNLPYDTVRRVSWILGTYKALQILFPLPERADAWLKRENALFGGQRPLDRMLAGDVTDLAFVRRTLDAVRGGGA